MWVLVNLPNNKTVGVQCDPKKNSQECLEKVCQDLGIICETDYFGLVHVRDDYDHQTNAKQWINLRNPLGRHGNERGPILLSLLVKFWVPAHLILQENVRNLFYIQARQELLDGHLKASSWENAAKLIAFLVHADGYKCTKNGHVKLQSSSFGNDENAIPVTIINNNRRPSKRKCSENESIKLESTSMYENYNVRVNSEEKMPENFYEMVTKEHEKLTDFKMTSNSAKYWLLEEISTLNGYGEEIFDGNIPNENTGKCKIGVSPHGLAIYKDEEKHNIPFTAVESAKSSRKSFRLTYLSEDHQSTNLEIKLNCHRAAAALYRSITEKHAFYSCETVRSAVTKQFIRDLKGTIASMFNEDTELGKRYVFDIRRTCREVYDNSRRILLNRGIDVNNLQQQQQQQQLQQNFDDTSDSCQKVLNEKAEMEKLVDGRILEALTCRICMDNEIDTMFAPCGHVTSCQECSEKCDRCPLCRASINSVNKIFLPTELRDRHLTFTGNLHPITVE
uniref:RING-type E3 ubiquitin transferase n=1 Tax=Corethrella appendiculata TaxID=1370023 RepID=U5EYX6_9DIPT